MSRVRNCLGALLCALSSTALPATECDVVLSPAGPIARPADALARVRDLRKRGVAPRTGNRYVVAVCPGRYLLEAPLTLGKGDDRIVFRGPSAPEEAVFEAGRALPPFSERADGVWETPVEKGCAFSQVWVNGRRAQLARSPNRYYFYMRERDDSYPGQAFYARPEDLVDLAAVPPEERQDVTFVIWQSWDMGYSRLESVDLDSGRVRMRQYMVNPLFFWDQYCPRYAYENCRSALDAPGEWFLDKKAAKLLYRPRAGERVAETRAIYPALDRALTLNAVEDVVFERITFTHVGMRMPEKGICNGQAAFNVKACAIQVSDSRKVRFDRIRLVGTGAHGVVISRACHDCSIVRSVLEDLGAGGVILGDQSKEAAQVSSHLSVEESVIRHGSRILQAGVGVWLGHVRDCRVVHNDIYDFLYSGVSVGWTWGYSPTPNRNNHIDSNRIHHIGQGVLSDMAGVYSLGDGAGSTVCGNWIWEVNGYADAGSPAWGLYTDEGSAHYLYASNLVEKCRDGGMHQHYGRENVYANNIFTGFRRYGAWRTRHEGHRTIELRNNIFYATDPVAKMLSANGPAEGLTDIGADGNVYWLGGRIPVDGFAGISWEAWRKQGHDAQGVIADPRFVDPDQGDWRLQPDSPALKAGFRAFDWRSAGVTDPALRRLADERTWDDFEDAPKAPRYFRTRGGGGFEGPHLGPARGDRDLQMTPWTSMVNLTAAVCFSDRDPAKGDKVLLLKELPGLEYPFEPHLFVTCRFDHGRVGIRFQVRQDDAAGDLRLELRDYERKGGYVSGPIIAFRNGEVVVEGRVIAQGLVGRWVGVEIEIDLDRHSWSLQITPRGEEGQCHRYKLPSESFKCVTWIGFVSLGKEGSTSALDDFHFGALGASRK